MRDMSCPSCGWEASIFTSRSPGKTFDCPQCGAKLRYRAPSQFWWIQVPGTLLLTMIGLINLSTLSVPAKAIAMICSAIVFVWTLLHVHAHERLTLAEE